jgi:hypothetical protein
MKYLLWLLALQGLLGAFDTIYYHEWRARLPAHASFAARELKLHAIRDFLYAIIFGTLPWLAWQGRWAALLGAIMITEILLTFADFIVEATVRKPLGDVYPGERVSHAIMGIIYGIILANLMPLLISWWQMPTAFVATAPDVPLALRWTLALMSAGVLLSGLRDLYAAYRLPYGSWPWKESGAPAQADNFPQTANKSIGTIR